MSNLLRISFYVLVFLTLQNANSFAESRCELYVDNKSIVHLKTTQKENEAYCIGYAHGRYRAVQMDHFRRTALGKTAEVYGFSALKVDIAMRLLNLPAWVDEIFKTLNDDTKKYLDSYASGASRGIQESLRLKQAELSNGYPEIEPWSLRDSLLVLLLQSFDQTRKTFASEIEQERASEKWGAKRAQKLLQSSRAPWETTILKKGETSFLNAGVSNSAPSMINPKSTVMTQKSVGNFLNLQIWPNVFGEESGSNNWVIRPNLAREKVAMLANDPHLDLRTPAFWMWIHTEIDAKSPDSHNAIGATLPGVPTLVNGTNLNVSWGLTNSYFNSANGYQISEDQELNSDFPLIWIKWYSFKIPFFFKRIQRTTEGFPILPKEVIPGSEKIALVWSGFFLKGENLAPMFQMTGAKSALELDQLLAKIGLPSWNFVFADGKGNIGLRTIGLLEKASEEEFGFHSPSRALKEVFRPLDLNQNPHLMNPARSWIATANNRHYPKETQLTGGGAYTQSFRAYRIEDLLQKEPKHDLESFEKIQCDSQAVDAKFFVPHIRKTLVDADMKGLEQALGLWDLNASEDCRVCGVYRWSMNRLMDEFELNETGLFALAQTEDPEWKRRTQEIFRQALKEVGLRPWSEIHKIQFTHISNLKKWNYSPELSSFGDKHSVSPGTSTWDADEKKFWHASGPSERFIVKMKNPPELYLNLPGLNVDYHLAKSAEIKSYPWRDWAQCHFNRVQWPLDWSQVHSETIE